MRTHPSNRFHAAIVARSNHVNQMRPFRHLRPNLAQHRLAALAIAAVFITARIAFGDEPQQIDGDLTVNGNLFAACDLTVSNYLSASYLTVDWMSVEAMYTTYLNVSELYAMGGIDIGCYSETSVNWLDGTTLFDISQDQGSFLWRDNRGGTVKNKMWLNGGNILTLYNGTTAGVILDPASGTITLPSTGDNRGIYAANTGNSSVPLLTFNSVGNTVFPNGLQLTSGQLSVATDTAASSSTTGALKVLGGIGVGKDSYFNGVRIGLGAGTNNKTNTAIGNSVLSSNSMGTRNSAIGFLTLANNVDGCDNTAIGYNSLNCNTCGSYNTATGGGSLALHSNGYFNAATGYFALHSNVSGSYNTAMGTYSLEFATGSCNTAVGYYSLGNNTTGVNNAALGYNALAFNGTGSGNVALGNGAGQFQGATGSSSLIQTSHSIYIGASSRALSNGDANSIVIGYGAVGQGANTTVIGNSDTVSTYINGSISTSYGLACASGSIGMAGGVASGSSSAALSNATALGYSSTGMSSGVAYGHYSTAAGMGAEADSLCCVALGGATDNSVTSSPDTWVEIDPLFLIGNGADQGLGSNAVTVLKNGQTTLTNKAWRAADGDFTPSNESNDNSQGNALVVEGNTVLRGKVVIEQPQGDISMGNYN